MTRAFRVMPRLLVGALASSGALFSQSLQTTTVQQPAPTRAPAIEEVFFQIREPASEQQVAFLRIGETLTIRQGAQIELFAVARPQGGQDRDLFRPQVRYSLPGEDRDELQLLDIDEDRGEVTLRALAVDPRRRRDATLHWKILQPVQAPAGLRSGTIAIHIEPDPNAAPASATPTLSQSRARALWTDLYRAILLREPDTFEGVARLEREGYRAVLEVAEDMARSDESAIRVYSRGVCNEQRLLALYRHLWGMSDNQIPRDQWERYLDMLDDRRIDDVVAAFLRSETYLARTGLERERQSVWRRKD